MVAIYFNQTAVQSKNVVCAQLIISLQSTPMLKKLYLHMLDVLDIAFSSGQ